MLPSCGAGSPLAGFVRFLQLLSQHPWKDRPLMVDPEAELTPAQHKDIDRRFDAAKAQGQLRGFTICTPTDLDGSAWGQGSMSTGMRQRLVKLAGRSLQVLRVCCMYQVSSSLQAVSSSSYSSSWLLFWVATLLNVPEHSPVAAKHQYIACDQGACCPQVAAHILPHHVAARMTVHSAVWLAMTRNQSQNQRRSDCEP